MGGGVLVWSVLSLSQFLVGSRSVWFGWVVEGKNKSPSMGTIWGYIICPPLSSDRFFTVSFKIESIDIREGFNEVFFDIRYRTHKFIFRAIA